MFEFIRTLSLWKHGSWEVLLVTLLANISSLKLGFGLGFSSPTSLELLRSGILSRYTFPIFSAVYALGVGAGCISAVPFLKLFGRKFVLILSSLLSSLGYILIATSSCSPLLTVGRAVAGLSAGFCFTTVPVYIGEIAHFKVKGFFAGFFGLYLRVGTLSAYILGMFLSFRWLALFPVFIDLLHIPLLLCLCYSPVWLVSRGLDRRGESVLVRLGRTGEEARRECEGVKKVLSQKEHSGIKAKLKLAFNKYNIKALTIGLTYMLFEPMTGTDIIDAYSTRILSENRFSLISPNTASVIFPLFAIAANIVLIGFVDRVGRKSLTIVSGVGIIICLFSMSIYAYAMNSFGISANATEFLGICPVVSLAGVRFLHGLGWGSVGFILLGELFPLRVRSTLVGISSFCSWLVIFAVLLLFPFLTEWFGYGLTFGLLGVLNIVSLLFVVFFLPETKKKTVEEIEELFKERTVFCLCCDFRRCISRQTSRDDELELVDI